MKIYFLTVWFLGFLVTQAHCETDSLNIEIAAVTVNITRDSLSIRLVCNNTSGDNLLLYGMDSGNISFDFEEERLCNPMIVGGGVCLKILDSNGKRMFKGFSMAEEADPNDVEPMTREHLLANIAKYKADYLKGTKVIDRKSAVQFDILVRISQLKLKSGEYSVQLIYYAGMGLHDKWVVGDKQIQEDMYNHDAELFQGCAITNTFSFRK